MGVAESIDVKDVDIGRSQEKVLDEACEKVPRIEKQEGDDEPEDVGRQQGDDEVLEERVAEQVDDFEAID